MKEKRRIINKRTVLFVFNLKLQILLPLTKDNQENTLYHVTICALKNPQVFIL